MRTNEMTHFGGIEMWHFDAIGMWHFNANESDTSVQYRDCFVYPICYVQSIMGYINEIWQEKIVNGSGT